MFYFSHTTGKHVKGFFRSISINNLFCSYKDISAQNNTVQEIL